MKTGLVLEGGGMRGVFTCGILDVLMEEHIEVDGLIGVSAGAAFGCNYISKQPGRAIRYNKTYCKDPRYCSVRSLIKTGNMFGAEFCYKEIPYYLDPFDVEAYKNCETEFYVVVTDVETGKAVYHRCSGQAERDIIWMQASATMPLAGKIVSINGDKYLDGGVADSIPLKHFEALGFERNIVVLTQPKGYIKGKNKALPAMKAAYRKYPEFLHTVGHRHEVYNAETAYVEQQEANGNCLVLRPKVALPIGRVEKDPTRLQTVYDIGRETAKQNLAAIKEFLAK